MAAPIAYSPSSAIASAFENTHIVGATWMLSSAFLTTYSTTRFLKYQPIETVVTAKMQSPVPRAALLTLLRFAGSLALGILIHPDFKIVERLIETWKLMPTFALPALFLFIANYSNSISLSRIGISLTYTSKCAIPLITLLLTVLLDGLDALPSLSVLLTLVPIGLGIATSSWNHPHFEALGFLAAFVSCTAQSALNVTTKRLMKSFDVTGSVAQRVMVAVGLMIASTTSIYQASSQKVVARKTGNDLPPKWLGALAVTAYHIEYLLSFTFVKLVAPITYSATDAVRRLGIIISGHYMFGGPAFTPLNILGIAMALGGALAYSILNK